MLFNLLGWVSTIKLRVYRKQRPCFNYIVMVEERSAHEQYKAHEFILCGLPKITAGGTQNCVHRGDFFHKCVLVNDDNLVNFKGHSRNVHYETDRIQMSTWQDKHWSSPQSRVWRYLGRDDRLGMVFIELLLLSTSSLHGVHWELFLLSTSSVH